MHDGMQHDLIQGQGQGHEFLKVGNLAIFPFILGTGKLLQILKLRHNTYRLSEPDF